MSDGKKTSDVDRWRLMLEESERELEASTERWREHESILCTAINRLSHQLDNVSDIKDIVVAIRQSVMGSLNIEKLKTASEQLVHVEPSAASGQGDGGIKELYSLLNKLAIPAGSPQAEMAKLLMRLEQPISEADIAGLIDEAVLILQPLISDEGDGAQLCSLMVSELMVQLLERLSLPAEVSERLLSLRKSLEQGVEQGNWSVILGEIADMAVDIRSRIHAERIETERFLKGVTERLDDVDGFLAGSEASLERSRQQGEQLDAAVSKEMQGLQASVKASEDIGNLKKVISLRLNNITQHLGNFRHGQLEQFTQTESEVRSLKERLQKVEEEAKRLRERIVLERKQAITDSLTGLNNRLAYDERIHDELARWRRFQQPACLAVWDVDFFKRINDDFGHAAGDNALKSIAKIISGKVRETDFLARYGGEEFVLYMPGADLNAAKAVTEKLRQAVESAGFHFRGNPVQITISCGVAQVKEGDTALSLFERADKALYQAKQQGRNQVVCS